MACRQNDPLHGADCNESCGWSPLSNASGTSKLASRRPRGLSDQCLEKNANAQCSSSSSCASSILNVGSQSDSKGLEKNANIQNPASTSAKSSIQNASTSASDRSEEFIENGIHYSQHVCMKAASRHDEPFPNSVSALSAKSCILDASVDSAKELIEDGRHDSQHVCNQAALPVHSCPSNSAQSIVPSAY